MFELRPGRRASRAPDLSRRVNVQVGTIRPIEPTQLASLPFPDNGSTQNGLVGEERFYLFEFLQCASRCHGPCVPVESAGVRWSVGPVNAPCSGRLPIRLFLILRLAHDLLTWVSACFQIARDQITPELIHNTVSMASLSRILTPEVDGKPMAWQR
jgi:hypothetical protein